MQPNQTRQGSRPGRRVLQTRWCKRNEAVHSILLIILVHLDNQGKIVARALRVVLVLVLLAGKRFASYQSQAKVCHSKRVTVVEVFGKAKSLTAGEQDVKHWCCGATLGA